MRKFLFVFLFLVVGLSYLFEVDKLIIRNLSFLNDIKLAYIEKVINISSNVSKYFDQVNTIEQLREENKELKQYKALYLRTQEKFDSLNEYLTSNESISTKTNLQQTRVLSYIGFNDFTKVWVDYEKEDDSILGLITEDYAAGILLTENQRTVALLNGNKKASYAVFIGPNKVPGIVTSSDDGKDLSIKFIPFWSDIKVGDEVVTSGMDNIFYEGLKVGKITEITKEPQMKVARLKPYANVLKKKYFYVYKENKPIKIEEKKKENETTNK